MRCKYGTASAVTCNTRMGRGEGGGIPSVLRAMAQCEKRPGAAYLQNLVVKPPELFRSQRQPQIVL